jgi:hypothetical protein
MQAVQELWGENPPTIKALTHRVNHLKKLAREHDPSNPLFKSKADATSVKKEEGYVTPVSSPKVDVKTPKKGGKKRDAEDVADVEVTPRRTRRKVKDVKYVEPELEEEGDLFVKSDGNSDEEEEDQWKPPKMELDGEEDIEAGATEGIKREEKELDLEEVLEDDNAELQNTEDRVTAQIQGVSNVLQENMSKANYEVAEVQLI